MVLWWGWQERGSAGSRGVRADRRRGAAGRPGEAGRGLYADPVGNSEP